MLDRSEGPTVRCPDDEGFSAASVFGVWNRPVDARRDGPREHGRQAARSERGRPERASELVYPSQLRPRRRKAALDHRRG
jgi:hypothetical protein